MDINREERNEMLRFHRVAAGDYETADGRYRMWRIPDVNPPAWNVIDTKAELTADQTTDAMIVDGAATKRDALGLFFEWWEAQVAGEQPTTPSPL